MIISPPISVRWIASSAFSCDHLVQRLSAHFRKPQCLWNNRGILQYLSDRIAIADLLTRYAKAVDERDWDLWKSVFTADATIDYTSAGGIAGDVETVAAWLAKTMAMFEASQHLVSNIEVTMSDDEATVRAMFFNPMKFADDGGFFTTGGWYNHTMVRTCDGWKSRRLVEESSWFDGGPS